MNIDYFIAVRKERGYSQSELAEGICTQATLSRFENNNQIPNLKILQALCSRLGISLGDLFPRVGVEQSEVIEKLNQAEFKLITMEYQQAWDLLETIQLDEESDSEICQRYHYIKGFLMIYLGAPAFEILFVFDQILLADRQTHLDIYRLLAYAGTGMVYMREGDLEKADFYFSRTMKEIYHFPTQTTEETWRVLHIVYQSGVYHAHIHEMEISNALLNYALSICADNHITYYLARAAMQLLRNAIIQEEDKEKIQELFYDARAYAKINRNTNLLAELDTLREQII
ncbi:helix-turn-helix domain-containing protein [Hutsoniella sourekii]|uniref:helix-turn-helix domain-containing protein n=1 Tax=Hutsoniella sourekii TaxID=87650 RepID=UPI000484E20C|nr:helix-turn-helix domain-containing protein [Hutsoniella sourekii]